MPITSYGLIVFRRTPAGRVEYVMIRRRDTLGFIDFMRGKYSVYNKEYILNMILQMTISEKSRLLTDPFETIWHDLWGSETGSGSPQTEQYRMEEHVSREKFTQLRVGIVLKDDFYTLETLIQLSRERTLGIGKSDGTGAKPPQTDEWEFAEWGFPKGRRNFQEKDYHCAVREFCEETGYSESSLVPVKNLLPFEEIFTGSNYKSYKHKYYLTYMSYADSLSPCVFQSSEVSCVEWKSREECMASIRYYNVEKKRVLNKIDEMIREYL